ncbi:DUF397 domain-containing protein [Actinoplanes regularis]|uniref:DUF397 domain-containing protein n=1 Tax=Actinoplanes regularis TaxID=52697 RepID=UPI0024A4FDB6|nr:DUF397 domain-containing protein [Actinoplanes regularis]GLW32978.1 hypothetical protein Areg01_59160 [Actinoplanes regularis]
MNNELAGFDRSTAAWKKSTRSGGSGGNCVEITQLPDGGWAIRDSKSPDGPVLFFTLAEWDAFVSGIKGGEFDG